MDKQPTIAELENKADYEEAMRGFMEELEQLKVFAENQLEKEYEQASNEDVFNMQIRRQKIKNLVEEMTKTGEYAE